MGIFDGALPAGWSLLNDEQRARAAALAIGTRFATGGIEVDPVAGAIFVLDGSEGYERHMMAKNPVLQLPETFGRVHQFDFGSGDSNADRT